MVGLDTPSNSGGRPGESWSEFGGGISLHVMKANYLYELSMSRGNVSLIKPSSISDITEYVGSWK